MCVVSISTSILTKIFHTWKQFIIEHYPCALISKYHVLSHYFKVESYHPWPPTTVSYFCNPGCVSQESLSVISCQLLSAPICVFTLIKGPSGSRRPIGRRRKSCNSMRNHERPNNRIGRKKSRFLQPCGPFSSSGPGKVLPFYPPLSTALVTPG